MDTQKKRQIGLICLGLAVGVLLAYGQVWNHGFINFDDPDYVVSNPHIRDGFTWTSLRWAFTTGYASNWHPLTWLSHLLDYQLYGMDPEGHHLTSVALHLANSVLLFLLLQRMTQAIWPSALVAALFALHPLHVESVAWVSERKDVLSGLFWMLTMLAWLSYVKAKRKGQYFLCLVLFALGLMAKPMLVTLPFVLLLLDYWPLQRRQIPLASLLMEKAPFLVLAAASCVVTFLAQRDTAVVSMASLSLGARLEDTPVAYVSYLAKTFWPARLGVVYPLFIWPVWMVAGATAILLFVSVMAGWRARSSPWFIVGWLWFLGTLVPVIGLVQVGLQAMADRYTYIPSIGLFIAVIWTAREFAAGVGTRTLAVAGALTVGLCLLLSHRQAAYWKDSRTLFLHTIQITTNNFFAYASLGAAEVTEGRTNEALVALKTSLRINPNFARPRVELGQILLGAGQVDEALTQLRQAVVLDPKLPAAHYHLGYALLAKGRVGEALDQFQAQVNLQPGDFKAQFNMGAVLLQNGLASDAISYLQKAVDIDPTNFDAHYLLGNSLSRTGRTLDAIVQFEKAIQIDPDNVQVLNDLAWILACNPQPILRRGGAAVEFASRADQLSGGTNAVVLGTLAATYAETGKFPDAVATEKRACAVARTQTNEALVAILEKRLQQYEAGSAWRDLPVKN